MRRSAESSLGVLRHALRKTGVTALPQSHLGLVSGALQLNHYPPNLAERVHDRFNGFGLAKMDHGYPTGKRIDQARAIDNVDRTVPLALPDAVPPQAKLVERTFRDHPIAVLVPRADTDARTGCSRQTAHEARDQSSPSRGRRNSRAALGRSMVPCPPTCRQGSPGCS